MVTNFKLIKLDRKQRKLINAGSERSQNKKKKRKEKKRKAGQKARQRYPATHLTVLSRSVEIWFSGQYRIRDIFIQYSTDNRRDSGE